MNAIECRDVWKSFKIYHERHDTMKDTLLARKRASYERFWALKGVDLDIPEGQTIGIIGSNGSGKSTLLKIAAKILRADKGHIKVDGKISALLELGAGFEPNLTGRENIYLSGAILRLTKKEIDSRFDRIVEFAELERFIDTPVKNYSSGMHMRLAFAVAISVDPDILLVDEILAVGDEAFQAKCYAAFDDFKHRDKTIVLVTHDLEAVRRFCNYAAWIDNGVVTTQGSTSDVIEAYRAEVYREAAEPVDIIDQPIPVSDARWGSGEATIADVRILDNKLAPKEIFQTDEDINLQIDYIAGKSLDDVVFGVSIFGPDGSCCYGTNTKVDNLKLNVDKGSGSVVLRYPKIPFLSGIYLIDVAVFDPTCTHPYDYRCRGFGFKVTGGKREKGEVGSYRLGHIWETK